jgi:PAS domain S-box-containing protein
VSRKNEAKNYRELEEEATRLAAAVEQAVDCVLISNSAGTIIYANPACLAVTGFPKDELMGRNLDVVFSRLFSRVREGCGKDGMLKGRFPGRKKDGSAIEIDVSVSPLRRKAGSRIANYVAVFHDVTLKAKLEMRMFQAQKMEALGQLAGGIAHSLNNILAPIILNAELLLAESPPDAASSKKLREILQAANRQRDLVKQILTFSRKSNPARVPARVVPILDEALKLVMVTLPASIEIRRHVSLSRDTILCNPTEIHQVIMNLCSNAADAIGGRPGRIDVSLDNVRIGPGSPELENPEIKPGDLLRLTVADNGVGIPSEYIGRIFDPFFTTKGPGTGTGFGLAVVHGIVRNHGGAVTVASQEGKGARFEVYLPLAEDAGVHAPRPPDKGGRDLKKGTVLLVDDETLVLESLQRALESLGYRVTAVLDGLEAWELFRKKPKAFDLVIVDQAMPKLTGSQLAGRILRLRPETPIILTTGYSQSIDEKKAKSFGIRGFILKPISLAELSEIVGRALRK